METKKPVFCNSCKYAKWVLRKGIDMYSDSCLMYDTLLCTKRNYVSEEAYNTPIKRVDATFDNLCRCLNRYNDCNEYAHGEPQKFFGYVSCIPLIVLLCVFIMYFIGIFPFTLLCSFLGIIFIIFLFVCFWEENKWKKS